MEYKVLVKAKCFLSADKVVTTQRISLSLSAFSVVRTIGTDCYNRLCCLFTSSSKASEVNDSALLHRLPAVMLHLGSASISRFNSIF